MHVTFRPHAFRAVVNKAWPAWLAMGGIGLAIIPAFMLSGSQGQALNVNFAGVSGRAKDAMKEPGPPREARLGACL